MINNALYIIIYFRTKKKQTEMENIHWTKTSNCKNSKYLIRIFLSYARKNIDKKLFLDGGLQKAALFIIKSCFKFYQKEQKKELVANNFKMIGYEKIKWECTCFRDGIQNQIVIAPSENETKWV